MIKERFTKIVNFMSSRTWGSCVRVWPYKSYSKNASFLLNLLFYSQAYVDPKNLIYSNDEK